MSRLRFSFYHILASSRKVHLNAINSWPIRHKDVAEDAVSTVCTTGYAFTDPSGKRMARCAVYFGPDDPRNRIDDLGSEHTHVAAKLIALTKAVEQLKHTNDEQETRIQTDFPLLDGGDYMSHFELWANRQFMRPDGVQMTHSEILKKLYSALKDTKITIEFKESVEPGERNYVNDLILSGKRFRTQQQQQPDFVPGIIGIDEGFTIDGFGRKIQSRSTKGWPRVYAMGMHSQYRNGFELGSYCTYWPRNEAGGGLRFRLAYFPVTLFRAQLASIEEALRQAEEAGLTNVLVTTDSAFFVKYYKARWLDAAEELIPNAFFYNRIRDLAMKSKLNVRFRYEKVNLQKEEWIELKSRCDEGLRYPLIGKDRREYDLELDEMTEEGISRELIGTGTKRVRLFVNKSNECNVPRGMYWDTVDDQINIQESELLPKGSSCLMILSALRKADKLGCESLVVRTNCELLIRMYESWLPIWQRNGWRNSLHKPIKESDYWKEVYELRKKIKVFWEFCETPSEEDTKIISHFLASIKGNKNS